MLAKIVNTAVSDRGMDVETSLAGESRVRVIRGLEEILAAGPMLAELAERCGHCGAADYLKYFLTGPYIGSKVPFLLLVYGRRAGDGAAGGRGDEELVGAVVVQEYQLLGAGCGIYMTDDETGERTVIARPAERAWVAAAAAEGLVLQRGARLILLSAQMDAAACKGDRVVDGGGSGAMRVGCLRADDGPLPADPGDA